MQRRTHSFTLFIEYNIETDCFPSISFGKESKKLFYYYICNMLLTVRQIKIKNNHFLFFIENFCMIFGSDRYYLYNIPNLYYYILSESLLASQDSEFRGGGEEVAEYDRKPYHGNAICQYFVYYYVICIQSRFNKYKDNNVYKQRNIKQMTKAQTQF